MDKKMDEKIKVGQLKMDKKQDEKIKVGQLKMEDALAKHDTIMIEPKGYSMYPLLVPGRDKAVITAIGQRKGKCGDVLLFRRDDGLLVLHRVCRVKPDGYYMVGDNQEKLEGPIAKEQVLGILVQIIRKGKTVSVRNVLYRFCAGVWLFLRPVRPFIKKTVAKLKKITKRTSKRT